MKLTVSPIVYYSLSIIAARPADRIYPAIAGTAPSSSDPLGGEPVAHDARARDRLVARQAATAYGPAWRTCPRDPPAADRGSPGAGRGGTRPAPPEVTSLSGCPALGHAAADVGSS